MSNEQTNQEFEIVDNFEHEKKRYNKKVFKLREKVISTANKLSIKQGFNVPIGEYNCVAKNAANQTRAFLKKLVETNKKNGFTTEYSVAIKKDAQNTITHVGIKREQ